MDRVGRPNSTTSEQRGEIWRRWKEGQSLSDIGRALGNMPGSVYHVVKANGGYVPAERTRSARVLSAADREVISRGIAAGSTLSAIAKDAWTPTHPRNRHDPALVRCRAEQPPPPVPATQHRTPAPWNPANRAPSDACRTRIARIQDQHRPEPSPLTHETPRVVTNSASTSRRERKCTGI